MKFLSLPFPKAGGKDKPKSSSRGAKLNYTRPTHRDKREVKKVEIAEPKTVEPKKIDTPKTSLFDRFMDGRQE